MSLRWKSYRNQYPDENGIKDKFGNPKRVSMNSLLSVEIQANGDLVMGELLLTRYKKTDLGPSFVETAIHPANDVEKLRFTKTN